MYLHVISYCRQLDKHQAKHPHYWEYIRTFLLCLKVESPLSLLSNLWWVLVSPERKKTHMSCIQPKGNVQVVLKYPVSRKTVILTPRNNTAIDIYRSLTQHFNTGVDQPDCNSVVEFSFIYIVWSGNLETGEGGRGRYPCALSYLNHF